MILDSVTVSIYKLKSSVADPDPESGAFLTHGSRIRDTFCLDPVTRIPDLRSRMDIKFERTQIRRWQNLEQKPLNVFYTIKKMLIVILKNGTANQAD
jgi:hypothetical protein